MPGVLVLINPISSTLVKVLQICLFPTKKKQLQLSLASLLTSSSQSAIFPYLLVWQSMRTLGRLGAQVVFCVGEADFALSLDGCRDHVYLKVNFYLAFFYRGICLF